ncbi:protein TIFY 5A-like [Zingiber officinale]|uniref:Protein TIFY n=1 Tax=Zingiber officinale TaxID=94328 RepID=A0A8J5C2L0_ZINOF|nr:protein TIFY 5A-like [Zingiber officinale]KAG6471068.1 hypothetical protein ZIOFF_072164 [Zingiber officinale]
MMGTRYDPELWLSIGGEAVASAARNRRLRRAESPLRYSTAYRQQQLQHKQQMTIFYNGQVCVCDATEMQARAIIGMAEKETEAMIGKKRRMNKHDRQQQQEAMAESTTALPLPLPPSPSPESLLQVLNPDLSMRQSLQRFLEKRKGRISEVTPYEQTPKLLFPLKPQHA